LRNLHGLGPLLGFIGVALATTTACGGQRVKLPSDFDKGMDHFVTDGRDGPSETGEDEEYELGPYLVKGVKRNLTIDQGWDIFEDFEPARKSGYRYSLSGGGSKKLTGKCAEQAPKKTKKLDGTVETEEEEGVACICELSGAIAAQVRVRDLAGEYGGQLNVADALANVVGIYRLVDGERIKGRPAGYSAEDENGALAAIETLPGEAHVWLKRRLKEPGRRRLVCALAGLMLWFPEEDD
jgi:hypothetical protein